MKDGDLSDSFGDSCRMRGEAANGSDLKNCRVQMLCVSGAAEVHEGALRLQILDDCTDFRTVVLV